jgi:hypothetical protein
MDAVISRFFEDLAGRLTGPLTLRLFLQPIMSTLFAVKDGIKDAAEGRPAYLWSLFTDPENRVGRIRECWKAVGKIAILALVLDAVYQIMVFRWFYVGEALVTAVILAIVPYVLLRGIANRVAHWWMGRGPSATRRRGI